MQIDTQGNWQLYQPIEVDGWDIFGTVITDDGATGAFGRNRKTGLYAQINAGVIRRLDKAAVDKILGDPEVGVRLAEEAHQRRRIAAGGAIDDAKRLLRLAGQVDYNFHSAMIIRGGPMTTKSIMEIRTGTRLTEMAVKNAAGRLRGVYKNQAYIDIWVDGVTPLIDKAATEAQSMEYNNASTYGQSAEELKAEVKRRSGNKGLIEAAG